MEARQRLLAEVCDTLLPPLASDAGGAIGDFWRTSASGHGIPSRIAAAWPALPPHVRSALEDFLEALEQEGFSEAPIERREEILRESGDGQLGRFALRQLKSMVFGDLFGRVDASGRNPLWEVIGFPGPISTPPSPEAAPKTLPVEPVSGPEAVLSADVCIVGSGAGGSVIAARMAESGKSVLVLEAGGYRNEADFRQLEGEGAEMFLGHGLLWSEHGELGLLAGSTLGGGTVINSMACRPTPDDVRANWAKMGLDGVDGSEWDQCLDRVWQRIGVNTEATHYNRNTEVMIAGLDACGLGHQRIPRNASLDDDPQFCGYCNAGCQQGCKRSTMKTYLQDAADAGARFLVDCFVERVTTSDGRATGVEAVVGSGDGATSVRVDAPTVVVAAGGIESPALLLRSGIGGPAVGKNLQVHHGYMVTGVYEEEVEAWNGQVISAMSFDFMHCEENSGFWISPLGLGPAFWAGQMPWTDAKTIREEFLKFPQMATWHAIAHDHGSGEVVLGADRRALVRWGLEDEVDRRVAARGHTEVAKVHFAAGAREILTFHTRPYHWRHGEDFDAYLEELAAAPVDDYGAFSAHQMSSCRMGESPSSSVADCRGELHDVSGVWIGDGAALPTAPGVNPMISIMSLAERTALRLAEAGS